MKREFLNVEQHQQQRVVALAKWEKNLRMRRKTFNENGVKVKYY